MEGSLVNLLNVMKVIAPNKLSLIQIDLTDSKAKCIHDKIRKRNFLGNDSTLTHFPDSSMNHTDTTKLHITGRTMPTSQKSLSRMKTLQQHLCLQQEQMDN